MWTPNMIAEKLMSRLQAGKSEEEEVGDVMGVSVVTLKARRTRAMRHRAKKLTGREQEEVEDVATVSSVKPKVRRNRAKRRQEKKQDGQDVVVGSGVREKGDGGGSIGGGFVGGGGSIGGSFGDSDVLLAGGGGWIGDSSSDGAGGDYDVGIVAEAPEENCRDSPDGPVIGIKTKTQSMRNRVHLRPPPAHLFEEHERKKAAEGGGIAVVPFGEGVHFPSSEAAKAALKAHAEKTFTSIQVRNSITVHLANKYVSENTGGWWIGARFVASGDRAHAAARPMLPWSLASTTQKNEEEKEGGKGTSQERESKESGYRFCPARITVKAVRDENNVCTLVTSEEVNYHEHECSKGMVDAKGESPLLKNPKIQKKVAGMLQCRAKARDICDSIAAKYGVVITPKQIANHRRDRLGGSSAAATLSLLLERFASFSGSRCLLIDDRAGHICDVAVQSAAQRLLFERFGDNLIMDFTHNTNNVGFYLGSLMVTSVTGRGVSVYDFLCVEQTETMMTTLLEHFVKINPGATEKVKSFVIDKDYKEWRVLLRVFPESEVLLCQFHVTKWFAYAVTQRKYKLNTVSLRDHVLDILYSMVYAKSVEQFDVHRADLDRLLRTKSPEFLTYINKRWYSCRKMWSDCERRNVFTAMNTTSNRIESSWNQVKKILGKKLRIDLCLEAVFAYQTAVLRREYRLINRYAHRLVLRSNCDEFIRSAMADVSEYVAGVVSEQWRSFTIHDAETDDPYVVTPRRAAESATENNRLPNESVCFDVTRGASESQSHRVVTSDASWTRSCGSQVSSGLPCRHMFFVAKNTLGLEEFPVDAIMPRWRMSNMFQYLPSITANTTEIQSLRAGLLLQDVAFSEIVDADVRAREKKERTPARRIEYFRLRRFEKCNVVVLNNLEKRTIIEAEMAPLVKLLFAQSPPHFIRMAAELRAFVSTKLAEWQEEWRPNFVGGPGKSNATDNEEIAGATRHAGENENAAAGHEDTRNGLGVDECNTLPVGAASSLDASALDNDSESVNDKDDDEQVFPSAWHAVDDDDWVLQTVESGKEMDRVIAAALADEEGMYDDGEEKQRVEEVLRRLERSRNGVALPLPVAPDAVGAIENAVDGIQKNEWQLFGEGSSFDNRGLDDEFDVGVPDFGMGLGIPFPSALWEEQALPNVSAPAPIPLSHEEATPTPTSPVNSTVPSSISSSGFSAVLHDIAEIDARQQSVASPPSTASLSASTVSKILTTLVAQHLAENHSTTRPATKRRVSDKVQSIDVVRQLATPDEPDTKKAANIDVVTLPPRSKKKSRTVPSQGALPCHHKSGSAERSSRRQVETQVIALATSGKISTFLFNSVRVLSPFAQKKTCSDCRDCGRVCPSVSTLTSCCASFRLYH